MHDGQKASGDTTGDATAPANPLAAALTGLRGAEAIAGVAHELQEAIACSGSDPSGRASRSTTARGCTTGRHSYGLVQRSSSVPATQQVSSSRTSTTTSPGPAAH